jgi:2-dehydropantoate 2-reductase
MVAQALKRMTKPNKIHILGVGGIGGLISYELSTIKDKPEITLLFRSPAKVNHFKSINQSEIYINRIFKNPAEIVSSIFESGTAADLTGNIENLIISTKTYQTHDALKPYLQFINKDTNILLVQNGLGVVDELYKNVWPVVSERPNFYQGVINHGAFQSPNSGNNYEVSHSGDADFFIGRIPRDLTSHVAEEQFIPLFIKQLEDAKALKTTFLPYDELLLIQLKKFTVNACINPNTSIIDCINGELEGLEEVRSFFYDVISESVDIFTSTIPALKNNPRTNEVLNKDKLLDTVMQVGTVVNAKNSSSMRQDVINLRDTEIDYINGYVVTLAEANGLTANVNKSITKLLKIRLAINRKRNI